MTWWPPWSTTINNRSTLRIPRLLLLTFNFCNWDNSASGEKAKSCPQPGRNAPATTTSSPTLRPSKRDRGSGPCDDCGSKFHAKEKCYYFYPHIHTSRWMAANCRVSSTSWKKTMKGEVQKQSKQWRLPFSTWITDAVWYFELGRRSSYYLSTIPDFETLFWPVIEPQLITAFLVLELKRYYC